MTSDTTRPPGSSSASWTDPLQATARWTAAVRAGEREHPDRLVDDPWAARLAGPDGMAWLVARMASSVLPIVIRTRYFDDWLHAVAIDGPVRQVVLLGAGLDTRAWRLPWATGTAVFELDRAGTLAAKARELVRVGATLACDRRAVDADLGADWRGPLQDAGFDPRAPSAWLAEGVLFYLPNQVVANVLRLVTSLATPGSRLGFDIVNRAVLTSPWTRAWLEMQAAAGAPWIGTLDDPAATLADLGWAASVVQPGDPEANYGRWTLPVLPPAARNLPHSWYVTGERR